MMAKKRRVQETKDEQHKLAQYEERVRRAEVELKAIRNYTRKLPNLKKA